MLCAPWMSVAQLARREGVRFDCPTMRAVGGETAINTAAVSENIMVNGDRTTAGGQGSRPRVVAGVSLVFHA